MKPEDLGQLRARAERVLRETEGLRQPEDPARRQLGDMAQVVILLVAEIERLHQQREEAGK